jgi:hypothetical protein
VLALLGFVFEAQASADEGWVSPRFTADVAIQKDASLQVTEAIGVDFGAQQKHGIIRTKRIRGRGSRWR